MQVGGCTATEASVPVEALECLPQRAVATSLNLPLNTVKTHLRRTRLALTASLAKHEAPNRGTGQNHGVADESV